MSYLVGDAFEVDIERLTRDHDVLDFDCHTGYDGDSELNDFIRNDALGEAYDGWNQTFVAVLKNSKSVIGFYTLFPESFKIKQSVRDEKQKPYPHASGFKLARLAVDNRYQKKGLGEFLVKYALGFIISHLITNVGGRYITVDAYPHRVNWYCEKFGFAENTLIKQDGLHFTNLILDTKNYPEKLKL